MTPLDLNKVIGVGRGAKASFGGSDDEPCPRGKVPENDAAEASDGVFAMDKFSELENSFQRKEPLATFDVGDTVDVQVMIKEGDKERIQTFNGTVIARRGRGMASNFTVRRIVQGEGVERTFPLNSPKVVGILVKSRAFVRRAKLYYLRDRAGKGTRLKERIE